MSVMPHSGSKRFSSSLSGFPAPGRVVSVLKEQRSGTGGGEEARRLLVWAPSTVSLAGREGPEEPLATSSGSSASFPKINSVPRADSNLDTWGLCTGPACLLGFPWWLR